MALSTKTIKRRIKSISNTRKITKAMEMISAVKMRRAVANAAASRSYAELAWQMLQDVATKTNLKLHPLLAKRTVKKIAIVLVTSNRGLAGGFTSKLLAEVDHYIKNTTQNNSLEIEVLVLGKRGRKIYHNFGHTIAAEFAKIDLTTQLKEILPLARLVAADYMAKKYDQIMVAYMDFVSALLQVPKVKQIFPIKTVPKKAVMHEQMPGSVGLNLNNFKFEPSPVAVLNKLLPQLIEMQIYQAILESDASEHSARMMAMRSASDAARDMIQELNTTFNKARQAGITNEIAEVIGGAAALE